MTHSPAGTAGSLTSAAEFYTALQRDLQSARTVAQLEAIAERLDTVEFSALPERAQEDTLAHYAHRLMKITGAFA